MQYNVCNVFKQCFYEFSRSCATYRCLYDPGRATELGLGRVPATIRLPTPDVSAVKRQALISRICPKFSDVHDSVVLGEVSYALRECSTTFVLCLNNVSTGFLGVALHTDASALPYEARN